jgi:hypothetical protein
MPVNEDKAHLNEELAAWFSDRSTEFLRETTAEEFHQFLTNLISLKDVYQACLLVERVSGTKPDEDLIYLLLKDYNKSTIEELLRCKLLERK